MPTAMNSTQIMTAKTIGMAMRALAGICITGMMPVMLVKRMKKNSDVRNGTQLRPSRPMVCMTTPSRMKSTLDSTRFCTPVGTRAWRRPPMMNRLSVHTRANRKMSVILLTAKGESSKRNAGHSTRWLMGGNSSAKDATGDETPSYEPDGAEIGAGLRPGKASDAET